VEVNGKVGIDSHPLRTRGFADGAQVLPDVQHRTMNHVRAYYNGLFSGLSLAIPYERTEPHQVELHALSNWPYRGKLWCTIDVNPVYNLGKDVEEVQ
jgi:hypothetical protein